MKRIWWCNFLLFWGISGSVLSVQAQDSLSDRRIQLQVSGVADLFYAYDFDQPEQKQRQPFLFNHNRHNRIALNLGMVKFNLSHDRFRANVALHAGTYSEDNYASEPGFLKQVFEANVGVLLSDKYHLWLDAGVLPSHIGFESAISPDNWTLTRSILAENSPYFLTGAKLSTQPFANWTFAALIVNGWQKIKTIEGSTKPSFGTQVTYSPKAGLTFNWSTFLGSDDPDVSRRSRYFSNLYSQIQLSQKIGIIAGLDLGTQQQERGSENYQLWFSPVVIGRVEWNERWKTALRVEYYQDREGVLIASEQSNGFSTTGISLNVDYSPRDWIICRLEGRRFSSKDQIFQTMLAPTSDNFFLVSSLAFRF